MQETYLEYMPFGSLVNPSFWHKFTDIKLDIDRLSEEKRKIWGYFSNISNSTLSQAVLEVDSTSFNLDFLGQNTYVPARGFIINKNTIEHFKDEDKNALISNTGALFWKQVQEEDSDIFDDTSILNTFFILSFADIKSYHYYYWFCFPSPAKVKSVQIGNESIKNAFITEQIRSLTKSYFDLDIKQRPYFLIQKKDATIFPLKHLLSITEDFNINNWYFAFSDPSNSQYPGWNLKTFITFLIVKFKFLRKKPIEVLSFRLARVGKDLNCENSLILKVHLPDFEPDLLKPESDLWAGWEKNERGKFGPRLANLKNSFDPKCIAESAVDLNLKLMKWQLLPSIDLEKIKNCKCLLLGAGTLGCSVARTLLAWGVRNINFVDNGFVSYSNPVRQSLYSYEDCVKNRTKADAASLALKNIFPGVNSQGFKLCIPMPGHPIGESLLSQVKENVQVLTQLISEHDIIFLLMDSRESRWLPTVLGAHFQKIVINAALGFDTYLVMRHGFRSNADEELTPNVTTSSGAKSIIGNQLGCYFCNDVTSPGNSLKERTLDQQCTVTRPGVSAIAGALAAELSIAILQHKNGPRASAFYKTTNQFVDENDFEEDLLGILPHSIRGFLSTFTQVLPATQRYKQCVACSDFILNEYESHGFEFLEKVFADSKYLEELTGLDEIKYQVVDLEVFDLSDSD